MIIMQSISSERQKIPLSNWKIDRSSLYLSTTRRINFSVQKIPLLLHNELN